VVLGPHPDDPECVVITSRLLIQEGCELQYIILTTSPSGVEDEYARNWRCERSLSIDERKAEIRKAEQIASARMVGLSPDRVRFLSLDRDESAGPLDSPENISEIRRQLESLAPDMVLMPVGHDTNRTHALAHRVFRICAREMAERHGRPIVGLYHEDPKTTKMRADLYVLFGDRSAQWKAHLLRLHDSQQQRNLRTRAMGFDERILHVNRSAYGRLFESQKRETLGSGYAEAFEMELFGIS
jgi:LmbE family N-acetylglucosaminyl deacetylase